LPLWLCTGIGRILRPGGTLVVSTDYCEEPVDTQGRVLFRVPQKIFTRSDVGKMIAFAQDARFEPPRSVPLACWDRAVLFDCLGYTFLLGTFCKCANGRRRGCSGCGERSSVRGAS
jgi:hypothetical protein